MNWSGRPKGAYENMKIKSQPQTKKRSILSKAWRIFKKAVLYGFLFSILYILFCKWINPPITITQLNSVLWGHGLQLFPDHNGFDFKSIEKARKHNQKSRSLRGASTISQQVAKNIFLWQHGGYFRKGLEVYFTFMIEHLWSKKRILEMYLNVAEMGEGIFGVEAATRKYFNKPAKDLTRTEAAMIAACLPNPKGYSVKPLSRHVALRYPWILRQMAHLESDPDIQNLIH